MGDAMEKKIFKANVIFILLSLLLSASLCCKKVSALESPRMLDQNLEIVEESNYEVVSNLNIYSNGLLINLRDDLLISDKTLLISMDDVLRNFPFEMQIQKNANTITSFYNNNFIKFNIGSKIAYVNGRFNTLHTHIARIGKKIYFPLEFLLSFNDYTIAFVNNDIYLTPRVFRKLNMKEGTQYIHTKIDRYHLAFFIPTHWKQIKSNIYGVWNEYSQYRLNVDRIKTNAQEDILSFLQKYKQEIVEQYQETLFYEENRLNIGPNQFEHFKYKREDEQFSITNDVYITQFRNEIFIFKFEYNEEHQAFISSEFYSILSSVHKSNSFVNTLEEHYYEYEHFFDHNVKLEKALYSNMNVNGIFDIEGSIKINPDAPLSLFALVEKEKDILEFDIPLESMGENRAYFNTRLYSPFGLGKHNIHIYAKENIDNKTYKNSLVRFSVINLSNNINKHLIPTRYIMSNSMIASSLASILTVDSKNDFEKVDVVFSYLTTQIDLNELYGNTPKNSDQTIEDKVGNSLEINIAACAILRNLGISSKIYIGEFGANKVYFTEYEINGKNKILDPASQILYHKNRQSEIKVGFPFSKYTNFSNLDATHYKSLLKGYKLLNY